MMIPSQARPNVCKIRYLKPHAGHFQVFSGVFAQNCRQEMLSR